MSGLEYFISDGHFIVRDDCRFYIDSSTVVDDELAERMHNHAIESPRDPYRRKNLFYVNKVVADIFFRKQTIEIKCPGCNELYKITPRMYSSVVSK